MISYALLTCLIGLMLWLLFTKWKKIADAWVARFGELCFFAGLLAWLFANQSKVVG